VPFDVARKFVKGFFGFEKDAVLGGNVEVIAFHQDCTQFRSGDVGLRG
jgi:hypothetical protein